MREWCVGSGAYFSLPVVGESSAELLAVFIGHFCCLYHAMSVSVCRNVARIFIINPHYPCIFFILLCQVRCDSLAFEPVYIAMDVPLPSTNLLLYRHNMIPLPLAQICIFRRFIVYIPSNSDVSCSKVSLDLLCVKRRAVKSVLWASKQQETPVYQGPSFE